MMNSRRSIPSMFVKSIQKVPFDFSVLYNSKLVKYEKESSFDIQRRKMKLLSKIITSRFKDYRYLFQRLFRNGKGRREDKIVYCRSLGLLYLLLFVY